MFGLKLSRIPFLLSLFALCLVVVFVPLTIQARAGQTQVTTVNIIFPTEMSPVTTTSGKWVDVAFDITGASADYYITTITIAENGNSANIIGEYTQLIRLNTATKSITRQVDLAPGIANGDYDVIVMADLAADFDPANSPSDTAEGAVVIGDMQGLSSGALLVSKALVIVGALLDQWVPSSNLNEFYMTGNASEALSDEGRDTVDGISEAIIKELAGANDIAGGTSEVVSGTKGSVISGTPGIIDGALNLMSGIARLFSAAIPLEP